MRWLDLIWRMIAKQFALAFIFIGGGLLATILLPIAMIIPGERCERAQMLVHASFRLYLWLLQNLGVISLRIEGSDAEKCKGKIVIANHPSLLDVVILMSLIPRVQCIVKHQLWEHHTLGILMRRAEYIRNNLKPEELITACKAALTSGRTLIIFPEGTRTLPGALPRFNRGFANISLLTETSIVPAYITCTPPHLYKGEPWWRVPATKPLFHVVIGEPLDVKTQFIYGSRGLAARKLLNLLEQDYARMIGHG